MTTRTTSNASPASDALIERFHNLKNASLLDRGDAAVRLAAETIAVLRDLERRLAAVEDRIANLEGKSNAADTNA